MAGDAGQPQANPERFRAEVRDELVDERNDLVLSAASSWEIATKYRLGKLPLPEPPRDDVPTRMRDESQLEGLPLLPSDTVFEQYDVEIRWAT